MLKVLFKLELPLLGLAETIEIVVVSKTNMMTAAKRDFAFLLFKFFPPSIHEKTLST